MIINQQYYVVHSWGYSQGQHTILIVLVEKKVVKICNDSLQSSWQQGSSGWIPEKPIFYGIHSLTYGNMF